MAEALILPLDADDGDPLDRLNLDFFDEDNPDALNALIADLGEVDEDKIGFEDLSVASPYSKFGWRSRPFMYNELQSTDHVKETRQEIASEMRYRYGDDEVTDDARIIASELATNALIHGGADESNLAISGIFRARTIRGGIVFEAENASNTSVDSEEATSRGSHESGNGFELIESLAREHGGQVGRYKVVRGLFGREKIVTDPDEITRVKGRWVVWASFQDQNKNGQMLAA